MHPALLLADETQSLPTLLGKELLYASGEVAA
jgi:hypothetical protein